MERMQLKIWQKKACNGSQEIKNSAEFALQRMNTCSEKGGEGKGGDFHEVLLTNTISDIISHLTLKVMQSRFYFLCFAKNKTHRGE